MRGEGKEGVRECEEVIENNGERKRGDEERVREKK